ncbi:unnamed protein product [Paramecium primaurelia]|uniref:Uncharacterized protein n=1 Tax=Paramecium primaurelia TaxID=5886 RepID=A0A8S1L685_PARPR|nr:unnamed protein product [Paramecium primaurelia]
MEIINQEKFDKYLVNYFILNNLFRIPINPEIYQREDNSNYQYWRIKN